MSIRNLKNNLLKKQIKTILIRGVYHLAKTFKRKEIWLVSDRQNVANDNGYALFKYLNDKKIKGKNIYFVITKKSRDFNKVKDTGKITIFNSLFLLVFAKYPQYTTSNKI